MALGGIFLLLCLCPWGVLAGGILEPDDPTPPWDYKQLPAWAQAAIAGGGRKYIVTNYGATGNGNTVDTDAFTKAFQLACDYTRVSGKRAEVVVPAGKVFYVKPFLAGGPGTRLKCYNVTFRIDGTIITPASTANMGPWGGGRGILELEYFAYMGVVGTGTIDGRGKDFWTKSDKEPKLLSFFHCEYVVVTGITLTNAPANHLFFDIGSHLIIRGIRIIAPPTSPNTDAIHLARTHWGWVSQNSIVGGDDCIVFQIAVENFLVEHNTCGEGTHGISFGSLSNKDGKTVACTQNLLIRNNVFSNALWGARIKAWPEGQGCARNIVYKDLKMINVAEPVLVTQYYSCKEDPGACPNAPTKGVAIFNITFEDITGTSRGIFGTQFKCSVNMPCTGIKVRRVNITPSPSAAHPELFKPMLCQGTYGWASDSAGACILPQSSVNSKLYARLSQEATKCSYVYAVTPPTPSPPPAKSPPPKSPPPLRKSSPPPPKSPPPLRKSSPPPPKRQPLSPPPPKRPPPHQ